MFGFQSGYTTLNNSIHLDKLINEMKNSSFHFLAYADNNLYAMHKVYKAFSNTNKKIVVGQIINLNICDQLLSVVIYPINKNGYYNLLELSLSNQSNTYVSFETFRKYNSDLLIIIKTNHFYEESDLNINSYILESIKNIVSISKHAYIGIDLPYQSINDYKELKNVSKMLDVKIIPYHETKYLNKEDEAVYETILKIGEHTNELTSNRHFISKDEFLSFISFDSELLNNYNNATKLFEYKYQMPTFNMPNPPSEEKAESNIFLTELAKMGLFHRLNQNKTQIEHHDVYKKRLDKELEVIINMGFSKYFLIVYDFIKWAKQNDILVGPGRGSAAGALVSYCLGITDVDPIKYDLLFERFLNKERITMPDIDIDFPDYKRELVIDYVYKTYGENHVMSIQTFQTFGKKSAVRDVSKVIDIDKGRLSGIVSSVLRNKIDESDNDVKLLKKISDSIIGLPRQIGTHAAGIILSSENVRKYIPLQEGVYNFKQSQYEASDLEDLGLLKIDFLGLKNLSIIEDVISLVKEKNKTFNLSNISLNDKKTLNLLSSADTDGIFQLESSGIKNVLRKVKIDNFEDLVATLALYRPGPMDSIDLYVKRKNEGYDDKLYPEFSGILSKTFGIIIYQEQIMQIANQYAGFTLAEADLLRRGISNKDVKVLKEQELLFINKANKLGRNDLRSKEIYELILKFADYGFNRSHSVSYAIISYQMAYLKANYYKEFMSVLLTSNVGNESLLNLYIKEVKRRNIKIYNPCIINSKTHFKIYKDGLIMPLNAIKGISYELSKKIVLIQDELFDKDFLKVRKLLSDIVNEKQYEQLIYANAFRKYNLSQKTLKYYKDISLVNFNLYIDDFEVVNLEEYTYKELSDNEKLALGFNNMFDVFQHFLKNNKYDTFSTNKTVLNMVVYLDSIKVISTKKGDKMAFITFDDSTELNDVTAFPITYEKYQNIFKNGFFEINIKKNLYKNKLTYELISLNELKI